MIRNVRAFTVFELLVVMVISGILTGIVYYALRVVQSSYHTFSYQTENVLRLKTFAVLLQRDFQTAEAVTANGEDELECHFPNYTIKYNMTAKAITRTINNDTEAFEYEFGGCEFFQDNMLVVPRNEVVDRLRLTLRLDKEEVTLNVARPRSYFDHINTMRESQEY